MAGGRLALSSQSPRLDFHIDMGNDVLNRTADGFLTIGAVSNIIEMLLLKFLICFSLVDG